MKKYLIASDIDGTLIPHKSNCLTGLDIQNFNKAVSNSDAVLVYVSGRHLELALKGLKESGLMTPDFFICDVGSSIYFKKSGKWIKDKKYSGILKKSWKGLSRKDIASLLGGIDIKEQEKTKLKEFKQSYYLPMEISKSVVAQVKRIFKKNNIESSVIYSVDDKDQVGLLDILPTSASKTSAIKYLSKKIKIPNGNIVYSGDSGNDIDVFVSGIKSIVVANTRDEVKKEAKRKTKNKNKLYFAEAKHSCGVVEGLKHFGVVKKEKDKKLYIQMHSMHGLFRGKNLELGRDEDTGGQIVYVLELAKSFGKLDNVKRVDIITRKIVDPKYPGYSKDIEKITDKVNIVRISCGPKGYIKKVKLWPYLDEFTDNCKKYISKLGYYPDIFHSNYADSGLVCTKLSEDLGIPQVHTGHSLGKPKMQRLGVNAENIKAMDKIYYFTKRVEAEQRTFTHSSAIIVSSQDEKNSQYGVYKVNNKKINIIRPGIDLELFRYYKEARNKNIEKKIEKILRDNFSDPEKAPIFSINRMDYRKNLISLVRAFAENKKLQEKANLFIFVGPIKEGSKEQKNLFNEIVDVIDKEKLIGKALIYNKAINYSLYVPELYKTTARLGGVFVNPALIEPFGLTLLEAAAVGVPLATTKNGGPVNIIKNCQNGLLFDPKKPKDISKTILKIISDKKMWKKFSECGARKVKNHYSWDTTAKREMEVLKSLL